VRPAGTWLVNGLLVIGAIAGALVLVEAGLRVFYPQPMGVWHEDRDGLPLHWPGLVSYLPQFGLSVSFNSAGMRDREHSVEKPEGVLRLLVLGDSFMEALQVPFDASFPSLLERELTKKTGKRVEVLNASVSGWGTDDELQYLTSYGMRWKPDLVLVAMTLHNDISDNLRERFHTTRNGVLIDKPHENGSPLAYPVTQLKGFLATRLHLYQLLIRAKRAHETRAAAHQLAAHVLELFSDGTDERLSRGLELTSLLLERMEAVASMGGCRVVVALLPLAVQVSDREFSAFAQPGGDATRRLEIDRPQRLMKRVADRAGLTVIDLLPGFRRWTAEGGGSLYLERDGHWNQDGHRLAAAIAGSELVRLGLVSR
jgi:hypothetical protein